MDKNLYAYCDNNPVMREDPNGNLWTEILVGAALGVTAAALGVSCDYILFGKQKEQSGRENVSSVL